jgi:hypothetical protein
VEDLKKACQSALIPMGGTKTVLILRLRNWQQQQKRTQNYGGH